jgi:membrane protease YdiL (CAAX protease family)
MPIGPWGWAHLLGFGVLLPYAAYRSAARLEHGPLPPRARHFQVVLVQQAVFAAVSLAVARVEGIALFPEPAIPSMALALGLVGLLGSLALMHRVWRRTVEQRARLAYFFMPRTAAEKRLWAGLALVAGIGEELTYRGVMYTLLLRLTGAPAGAALVSAAIFGISHSVQGWGSALVTVAFGLGFQGLALVSGSLYLPMAVHVCYDLAAGLAYARYGEELGYPAGGVDGAASGGDRVAGGGPR